ncbi:hypothetical protein DACRYDRAFT_50022 [Dacryopinax primogenitus]|uniref:Uncharacterized protein n=1 Tax=Dacryopinax primogenitus (strain DJM 731) TaxID=1858805 RepID=M5GEG7_DACPD|nr:uncharacterized protein DACRYDRAFT_50022 [Dacryopinax primogenitus]EJU03233.1 hypothetical protein DACRYDRAFT_50022 [Dacryopinax primogenitus]
MKFTPAGPSIIHNASRYSRRLSTTAIRASPPPSDGLTLPQSDAYCQQLTKSTDYPAFLTSYFYPSLARPAWFALNAFHAEIAQVRRKVSKEILGEMRYTWWRDAVKAVIAVRPLPAFLLHAQSLRLTEIGRTTTAPRLPCVSRSTQAAQARSLPPPAAHQRLLQPSSTAPFPI